MTSPPDIITLFRWYLARREQLGRLVDDETPPSPYAAFQDQLRQAAALILARAAPGRLVFVGRSPESFFDYPSGALAGINTAPELTLLQLSLRDGRLIERMNSSVDTKLAALMDYFGIGATFASRHRDRARQHNIRRSGFPRWHLRHTRSPTPVYGTT